MLFPVTAVRSLFLLYKFHHVFPGQILVMGVPAMLLYHRYELILVLVAYSERACGCACVCAAEFFGQGSQLRIHSRRGIITFFNLCGGDTHAANIMDLGTIRKFASSYVKIHDLIVVLFTVEVSRVRLRASFNGGGQIDAARFAPARAQRRNHFTRSLSLASSKYSLARCSSIVSNSS